MICPKCNIPHKHMDFEDNRANTDRGVIGEIVYWCYECNSQFNEFGDELDN